MKHRRLYILLGIALLVGVAIAVFDSAPQQPSDSPQLPVRSSRVEPAPLCPWREPEADMRQFFPGVTRYEDETRILSGLRVELAQRLGRTPTAEENALRVHRIYQDEKPLGTVLVRRTSGEYGAIELVLAIDENGRIKGLRLQRLREPAAVTAALEKPGWLNAFAGKDATSDWQLGHAIADVPPEARTSAQAVVEAVRSELILLEMSAGTNVHHLHDSR